MIDLSEYPDRELLELAGIVGYREFENSPEYTKEELRAKLRTLRTLDDKAFICETESAIYSSALVSGFRGNWNHDHCYATACYHESERRKIAAGHLEDCRAQTLYSTAYGNVMRRQGLGVRDDYPSCECSAVKER